LLKTDDSGSGVEKFLIVEETIGLRKAVILSAVFRPAKRKQAKDLCMARRLGCRRNPVRKHITIPARLALLSSRNS
jgi:hypothetical protein